MASDGYASKAIFVFAAVLAMPVLPSSACRKARAPAPSPLSALAPAPAPTSVIRCEDCDSRCRSSSMCDAYVGAEGCGNACSGAMPYCEPCMSEGFQSCTVSCNEGCVRNYTGQCDCAAPCSKSCGDAVQRTCQSKCDYSYYAVKSCHDC
ncbi:hypothetical protein ZWY2020_059462 [Hordeum vulgare]|nr:hypothetical protein ZWY2020_059462 [Hordeum vulgare]